jgi:NAD(P)-dependent dehydrogenase (short-subunit alcohol dehydrogenase family)
MAGEHWVDMEGRQSQTALITGSTSGLGRHVAIELSRRGWSLLAHGRDRSKLDALVAELGERVQPLVADLSSLADVRLLARRIIDRTPRLDVLINNAAVGFGRPGAQREMSREGHELRFAVNYLAPVLLNRMLLPLLAASAPARVINVGSIGQIEFDVGDVSFERRYSGVEAYRRSKLALVAHTFDFAEETRALGVTVNCVHPANFMDTAMVRQAAVRSLSTVEKGTEAVMRLVVDAGLDRKTGQFFNGSVVGRALPMAYDQRFRRALRETTDRLLG